MFSVTVWKPTPWQFVWLFLFLLEGLLHLFVRSRSPGDAGVMWMRVLSVPKCTRILKTPYSLLTWRFLLYFSHLFIEKHTPAVTAAVLSCPLMRIHKIASKQSNLGASTSESGLISEKLTLLTAKMQIRPVGALIYPRLSFGACKNRSAFEVLSANRQLTNQVSRVLSG